MANTMEYAKKFVPMIDSLYKQKSVTACMDSTTQADFTGANEIKVLKVSTSGLGDYSREEGYPAGDVTVTWETMTLKEERGKEISIDRMDNEEVLGQAFGTVINQFMSEFVVPELDAYRFAAYASDPNITKVEAAALTADTILEAIDEASRQMDADEVPDDGRILFVNSDLKKALGSAVVRQWGSQKEISNILAGYNGMKVIYVPKSRFYTGITLGDGQDTWGYTKKSDAKAIQFLMLYPQSVLQVEKFALPKIFSPDENQIKDAWKFQYRLYHDAFVYENKGKGVYAYTANA